MDNIFDNMMDDLMKGHPQNFQTQKQIRERVEKHRVEMELKEHNAKAKRKRMLDESRKPKADLNPEFVKEQNNQQIREVRSNVDVMSDYISNTVKKEIPKTDPQSIRETYSVEERMRLLEQDVFRVQAQSTPNTLVAGIGTSLDSGGGAVWLWDLDDVSIGTPMNGSYPVLADGDTLLYDLASNKWVPGSAGTTYVLPIATDSTLGGITLSDSFVTDSVTGELDFSDTVTIPNVIVPDTDGTGSVGSNTLYFEEVYSEAYVTKDTKTGDKVVLTIRNNQIIITDSTQEITTAVDLGGTTPDPGSLTNVYLDGSGRYAVGVSGQLNANGLVTQEFINSPGQFFVINDIDGGVFGPGDRQAFGLIRETLYDATDLDGGPAYMSGGSSGAWSIGPTWFYTGGNPYLWTYYGATSQTPGGSGEGLTGAMGNQNYQRSWWGLCTKAEVGKRIRIGIANGTQSDPTGTNYTNKLIQQLYVSQEMLDHPDASTDLPASVISNGVGYYTCFASQGEYENMGSFPDGVDKGYRFRWSTFGRTALSQLPYVSGVANNDQIAAASGLVYYVVYDPDAADVAAANVVLADGTTSANNEFYPSVPVKILQFNQPYTSFTTPADRIYDLKYTEAGSVQQSPIFHNYPISTTEEIIENSQNAAGVQKLRREVCQQILDAVTGYYLIRDLSTADRTTASAFWSDILTVALAGQLQSVYDLTAAKTAEPLAPQELLDAVTETAKKWINTFPVAGQGTTLFFI
mgnify:FL=1